MIDLRIGIVGIRGLPPKYGGYETFADHFAKYMCQSGHEVVVACEKVRGENMPNSHLGAKLVYFPLFPPRNYRFRKIFEGIYDIYFYFKLAKSVDIMYILAGLGTNLLIFLRIFFPNLKIVTNNDGLEWKRSKYSLFERLLWKSFIRNSLRYSHLIVHDNPALLKYFPKHKSKKTAVISYGVDTIKKVNWSNDELSEYAIDKNLELTDLEPNNFYIVVARLQHDNNTHMIIDGYIKSKTEKTLIVVGDFQDKKYENLVKTKVKDNKKVIFTGGIYNPRILNMLRTNSYCYLHGHSAGGTNPALLEAMSMSIPVIAHDNDFNRHVLDNSGLFFESSHVLSQHIDDADSSTTRMEEFGKKNFQRANEEYTWEECFEKHERHFQEIL